MGRSSTAQLVDILVDMLDRLYVLWLGLNRLEKDLEYRKCASRRAVLCTLVSCKCFTSSNIMTISEVAERSSIPKGTVMRVLHELYCAGIVDKRPVLYRHGGHGIGFYISISKVLHKVQEVKSRLLKLLEYLNNIEDTLRQIEHAES